MLEELLKGPMSGASLMVALALLWWRIGRAERDIERLTERMNEYHGG